MKIDEILDLLEMTSEEALTLGICGDEDDDGFDSDSSCECEDFEPEIEIDEDKHSKRIQIVSKKVRAIENTIKTKEVAPFEELPDAPFSLCYAGRPGSGKTTLLIQLLEWFQGYFDNIYLWSHTFRFDTNWLLAVKEGRIPEIPKSNIFRRFNTSKFQKLYKQLEKKNKGKVDYVDDKIKTLFIFDDIVGEIPRKFKGKFNDFIREHRHTGCSHVTLSQEYKAIPPLMRKNCFSMCLFDSDNELERKAIIEELGGTIGRKRFENIWNDATKGDHNFLVTRPNQNDKMKKLSQNFEHFINPFSFSNDKLFRDEENLQTIQGIEDVEDVIEEDIEEEEEEEMDDMEVLFKLINKN